MGFVNGRIFWQKNITCGRIVSVAISFSQPFGFISFTKMFLYE